jgi:CubicO group peptidase (beta-lactamase class C family)
MSVATAPDAVSSVPGRYGWAGGYGSGWFNHPDRRLVAIVMTQVSDFLFSTGVWTSSGSWQLTHRPREMTGGDPVGELDARFSSPDASPRDAASHRFTNDVRHCRSTTSASAGLTLP